MIMPQCGSKVCILCRILVNSSQKVLTRTGKALEKDSKDGKSCKSAPVEGMTKQSSFQEYRKETVRDIL